MIPPTRAPVRLTKYQALGNSYLVLDPADWPTPTLSAEDARALCDINLGIGSDGVLFGPPGDGSPFRLRIINPDGSPAEKSGNGIRIFARYLFDRGLVPATAGATFDVEVLFTRPSGEDASERVGCEIIDPEGPVFRLAMGTPRFGPEAIAARPDAFSGDAPVFVVPALKAVSPHWDRFVPVSMGNPHCVCFLDRAGDLPPGDFSGLEKSRLAAIADAGTDNAVMVNGCNLQWAWAETPERLHLRIFERGAGPTPASGSSASGAAAAAYRLGLIGQSVEVVMPGGSLKVDLEGPREAIAMVHITGGAERICTIEMDADYFRRSTR